MAKQKLAPASLLVPAKSRQLVSRSQMMMSRSEGQRAAHLAIFTVKEVFFAVRQYLTRRLELVHLPCSYMVYLAWLVQLCPVNSLMVMDNGGPAIPSTISAVGCAINIVSIDTEGLTFPIVCRSLQTLCKFELLLCTLSRAEKQLQLAKTL